jgi:hypothetical protein
MMLARDIKANIRDLPNEIKDRPTVIIPSIAMIKSAYHQDDVCT